MSLGIKQKLILLVCGGGCISSSLANAIDIEYGTSLRYRYEYFSRDQDTDTPPGAESKASTVRLGVILEAKFGAGFAAFADVESVHQLGEDNYNIPTIPSQSIPGYPVISDPEGIELNQIHLRWSGPMRAIMKVGVQEIKLNDGRFISDSLWRQNHQSFDAATLTTAPSDDVTVELGHLRRVHRVLGSEASNGRTDLLGNFYNLAYVLPVGVLKTYGVFLDFDTELANSTDTHGLRLEGSQSLGESNMRLLATLDYARQRDAGSNPNEVDVAYRLLEIGFRLNGLDLVAGQSLLEGKSITNKFSTPLAHPFNGLTELFLTNPSLGADNHGLDARFLRGGGSVPGIEGLTATLVFYDYRSNSGNANYGRELDLDVAWVASRITKGLVVGWRFGQFRADQLFSDALRTSVWASYKF